MATRTGIPISLMRTSGLVRSRASGASAADATAVTAAPKSLHHGQRLTRAFVVVHKQNGHAVEEVLAFGQPRRLIQPHRSAALP